MEFAELIKTPKVDNCILRRSHGSLIEGTLCLTSHHLIFSSRASDKDELMVSRFIIVKVGQQQVSMNVEKLHFRNAILPQSKSIFLSLSIEMLEILVMDVTGFSLLKL